MGQTVDGGSFLEFHLKMLPLFADNGAHASLNLQKQHKMPAKQYHHPGKIFAIRTEEMMKTITPVVSEHVQI